MAFLLMEHNAARPELSWTQIKILGPVALLQDGEAVRYAKDAAKMYVFVCGNCAAYIGRGDDPYLRDLYESERLCGVLAPATSKILPGTPLFRCLHCLKDRPLPFDNSDRLFPSAPCLVCLNPAMEWAQLVAAKSAPGSPSGMRDLASYRTKMADHMAGFLLTQVYHHGLDIQWEPFLSPPLSYGGSPSVLDIHPSTLTDLFATGSSLLPPPPPTTPILPGADADHPIHIYGTPGGTPVPTPGPLQFGPRACTPTPMHSPERPGDEIEIELELPWGETVPFPLPCPPLPVPSEMVAEGEPQDLVCHEELSPKPKGNPWKLSRPRSERKGKWIVRKDGAVWLRNPRVKRQLFPSKSKWMHVGWKWETESI